MTANPLLTFYPEASIITNISNSRVALVTTSQPHGYFDGLMVTINIPYPNKMQPINGKTYPIIVFSPTQFFITEYISNRFLNIPSTTIGVDTSNLGPFTLAPLVRIVDDGVVSFIPGQQAQAVPAAELTKFLNSAEDVIGPNNPLGT